jgi:hypothetical protein
MGSHLINLTLRLILGNVAYVPMAYRGWTHHEGFQRGTDRGGKSTAESRASHKRSSGATGDDRQRSGLESLVFLFRHVI